MMEQDKDALVKLIDPEGKAEAAQRKLIEAKGEWWTRKAMTLGGIKSVSVALSHANPGLADAMVKIYAADLVQDIGGRFPEGVDVTAKVKEMLVDAQGLISVVVGLATELPDSNAAILHAVMQDDGYTSSTKH
jgi:hypothetical protein